MDAGRGGEHRVTNGLIQETRASEFTTHTMTEAEKKEITWKFYAAISACDINLLKAILTDEIVGACRKRV